jgi:hypothetical protein
VFEFARDESVEDPEKLKMWRLVLRPRDGVSLKVKLLWTFIDDWHWRAVSFAIESGVISTATLFLALSFRVLSFVIKW